MTCRSPHRWNSSWKWNSQFSWSEKWTTVSSTATCNTKHGYTGAAGCKKQRSKSSSIPSWGTHSRVIIIIITISCVSDQQKQQEWRDISWQPGLGRGGGWYLCCWNQADGSTAGSNRRRSTHVIKISVTEVTTSEATIKYGLYVKINLWFSREGSMTRKTSSSSHCHTHTLNLVNLQSSIHKPCRRSETILNNCHWTLVMLLNLLTKVLLTLQPLNTLLTCYFKVKTSRTTQIKTKLEATNLRLCTPWNRVQVPVNCHLDTLSHSLTPNLIPLFNTRFPPCQVSQVDQAVAAVNTTLVWTRL